MAVKIGEKAPLFTLFDQNKSWVSLEQFRGNLVTIMFFPFAFTDTCLEDLKRVSEILNESGKPDTQFLGISVDSVFALSKFAEINEIGFPLLSDFNREVSRSYGVFYEEYLFNMRGVSKKGVFVIGREGVLRYVEVLEKETNVPKFDEIRKILDSID
jgi:peroxiredoxin